MKATAIIDWVTFSVKGEVSAENIITNILRMDKQLFEDTPYGQNGYRRTMRFDTIRVFYDPAEDRIGDMGVCVSMSGSGCRLWEQHTEYQGKDGCTPFVALFEILHIDPRVNISRVDLALDDMQGLLDLDIIEAAVDEDTINSRIKHRVVTKKRIGQQKAGKTIYFGSESSDFRIRIYDKAKQMYNLDEEGYNKHWVRFEMVMRGANANGFVACVVNSDNDLGLLASGILNDKLAFIERDDTNITRCTICQWWLDFVDAVAAVKLVSKEEINHKLEDKIEWISRQIAPTLSLINDARGFFMIRDILAIGEKKRTAQQQALLDSYRKAYHMETAN